MECLAKESPWTVTDLDRLKVGLPQLLVALISLFANVALLRVLVLHPNWLHSSFRWHVISLTVASVGFVLVALLVFTPIVLFDIRIEDPCLIVLSTPDSLFYQVIMFATTSIAVERCSLFIFPKFHSLLSGQLRVLPVILPWMASVFVVCHSTFLGCYKRVDPFALRYTYNCSSCDFYGNFLFLASIVFPLIISISYLMLFVFLYFSSRSLKDGHVPVTVTQRYQVLFAVHFSVIALCQLLASSSFYLLPVLLGNNIWTHSLLTVCSTFNSMANPLVMFCFQSTAREALIRMTRNRFLPLEQQETSCDGKNIKSGRRISQMHMIEMPLS